MTFSAVTYFVGVLLVLLQVLASLPWILLSFVDRNALIAWLRRPFARATMPIYGIVLAIVFLLPALFHFLVREGSALEMSGQIYAAVLQTQLLADAFILLFALLLWVWPKGGAIALAAFREGLRQPMFWLLFGAAFLAMFACAVHPLLHVRRRSSGSQGHWL